MQAFYSEIRGSFGLWTSFVLLCAASLHCQVMAQGVDPIADKAMQRCSAFGFTKGTLEFATCASEQTKALSIGQPQQSVSEDDQESGVTPAEGSVAIQSSVQETANATITQSQATPAAEKTDSPSAVTKFTGSDAFIRSVTVVPTGAIEVDVQSNKGGAAAFGLIGAIVESAATSDQSQADENVIAQYVTASDTDPRKKYALLLAEYLTSCFAKTEAYTTVVQPLLGASAWRLKDKRIDETRYESLPATDYIVEAKLTYTVIKTLLGTQLMIPVNVSIFRQQDQKEVKRFSATPNKLFGEFSALDGVSELELPTGDLLREGAMKISNKICKAKL